jgi:hypothetical protein
LIKRTNRNEMLFSQYTTPCDTAPLVAIEIVFWWIDNYYLPHSYLYWVTAPFTILRPVYFHRNQNTPSAQCHFLLVYCFWYSQCPFTSAPSFLFWFEISAFSGVSVTQTKSLPHSGAAIVGMTIFDLLTTTVPSFMLRRKIAFRTAPQTAQPLRQTF